MLPIGLAVVALTTVSLEPPMLLTYSFERSQSGVMCSGLRPVLKRPMILKVLGSITVTSPDSSLGTYTRGGRLAMRGSSVPLTVAAYTPPTGGGVGVGAAVGDPGVAAALALAVGMAAAWLGSVVRLGVGVGEEAEQEVAKIPTRASTAARRNDIGAQFRRCGASAGGRRPYHPPTAQPKAGLHRPALLVALWSEVGAT